MRWRGEPVVVLRLAKVRSPSAAYYFETALSTAGQTRLVEADPVWIGDGCHTLGLSGRPTPRELGALLAGADPGTGEPLTGRRREIAAFDFVFSAPKSVSIVHSLASDEASTTLERAHDAAVEETFAFIERSGLAAMRTRNGDRFEIPVEGAPAAAFRHRTSRRNDPHLHTHVLMANMALGSDGRWSAVSSLPLYRSLRAAQSLFEAHLRAELSSCGVRLGPMRSFFADIAAVPDEAVLEFSRRGREIAAAMAEEGLRGPMAAALLSRATRPRKDRSSSYEVLQGQWRERGYRVGLSPSRIEKAAGDRLTSAERRRPDHTGVYQGGGAWAEEVLLDSASPYDGTFSRDDVIVAACRRLPSGRAVRDVERTVDALLSTPQVVAEGRRFTTPSGRLVVERAAERLGRVGEESGAVLLTYPPGGRLSGLDGAGQLSGAGRMVALAAGRRAAHAFEASSGIETVPVGERAGLSARLGGGDLLVLADCTVFSELEVTEALETCRLSRATPILFTGEEALSRSRLLEVVSSQSRRLEPSIRGFSREPLGEVRTGQVAAVAVAEPWSARALAIELASSRHEEGGEVAILAPERCVAEELRRLSAGRFPVVEARQSAALFESGHGPPSVVVMGGLRAAGGRLRHLPRTHVVAVAGESDAKTAAKRLLEALSPPDICRVIGPVPIDLVGRQQWRDAALSGAGRVREATAIRPLLSRDGAARSLGR